jgi:hypothetical protein
MIDRLIENGRWYLMEMNEEKTKVTRISRQPSQIQIMIDKKQLENVEYFNYLGSLITNDARCTSEMKSNLPRLKQHITRRAELFMLLNLRYLGN